MHDKNGATGPKLKTSFLEQAIYSQPDQLNRMLEVDVDAGSTVLKKAKRIWLVGTGSSQHAAELGAWLFLGAGIDARWSSSANFASFATQVSTDDAVLVISHTTHTAFARSARSWCLANQVPVLSITGTDGEWAEAIRTVAAEKSDTYTVSYTSTLIILAHLAASLSTDPALVDALQAAPLLVEKTLENEKTDPLKFSRLERLLVITGVGHLSIAAREGALKFREAARIISEGFEAEYLLHGSAVPLKSSDLLIVLQPQSDQSGLLDGIAEAADKEGINLLVINKPADLHPFLLQLAFTIQLQCAALVLARINASDPDKAITGAWTNSQLWQAGSTSKVQP